LFLLGGGLHQTTVSVPTSSRANVKLIDKGIVASNVNKSNDFLIEVYPNSTNEATVVVKDDSFALIAINILSRGAIFDLIFYFK
jgi:hypothetical protein